MKKHSINDVLKAIQVELDLSSQTERELLEEVRTHLEDAVADAKAKGTDEEVALLKAAEKFGVEDVGVELQKVHMAWESADAVIACIMPVIAALILRWLVFAPDGTAIGWQELLIRPAFWIVAVVALLVPVLQFHQWRYALIGWGLFWVLSVIFVAFPVMGHW